MHDLCMCDKVHFLWINLHVRVCVCRSASIYFDESVCRLDGEETPETAETVYLAVESYSLNRDNSRAVDTLNKTPCQLFVSRLVYLFRSVVSLPLSNRPTLPLPLFPPLPLTEYLREIQTRVQVQSVISATEYNKISLFIFLRFPKHLVYLCVDIRVN